MRTSIIVTGIVTAVLSVGTFVAQQCNQTELRMAEQDATMAANDRSLEVTKKRTADYLAQRNLVWAGDHYHMIDSNKSYPEMYRGYVY